MANLTLRCTCGKTMSVPDQHRGVKIKCRQCGVVMRVPLETRPAPAPTTQGVWTLHNVGLLFKGIGRSIARVHWRYLLAPSRAILVARLAWLYFIAVCVVCAVMWTYGDTWWVGTVLLFIGRWIFLVPGGILAVAALFLHRKSLIPLLGAALITVGPIMGFRAGWQRMLSHPAGMHVRIVTLNIEGGDRNWVLLSEYLERWKPDVLALQECGEALRSELKELKGWYTHSANDQCLVSHFPITDSSVMNRRTLERIHGDTEEGIGGAGYVVRYTLQTPRGPINLTNLHLETPRKGLEDLLGGWLQSERLQQNTELRAIEAQLARQWVNVGKAPTLVVGDFNTPVESQIFRTAWGDMTDAFSRVGYGLGMTKRNGWIRARIDHVLSGPGWYADRVTLGDDVGSDHLPLIVDLTLAPERPASP
ncbi:MAG: putative rane protein [Gemmatimonadetes bacterium]|nr:putative rane protein [Gemmatimonadota bacterium]